MHLYEVHLWMKDENGDWWWEPEGGAYSTYEQASHWFEIYKAGGYNVRLVETKVLKYYEDNI